MSDDPVNTRRLVKQQYERFPYPVGESSLDKYIASGARQSGCPSMFFDWYWPCRPATDDLDILIAGCGTNQAAKFAFSLPGARFTAIDISEHSLDNTAMLMRKHGITNLQLQLLPIEEVGRLEQSFDLIISTGVLHHLPDPAGGLRALSHVLRTDGSMYLMLYGKYGRDGVYYLQDLFRRMGLTADNVREADIQMMVSVLERLPPFHALSAKKLFFQKNMNSAVELVDLFLHPQDRGYSLPDIYALLNGCGLKLQRLLFRAHYDPRCTALRNTEAYERICNLPRHEQYAVGELFRAATLMHFFVACPQERDEKSYLPDMGKHNWDNLIPVRNPASVLKPDPQARPGVNILHNAHHQFPGIQYPMGPREIAFFSRINAALSVNEILTGIARDPNEPETAAWACTLLEELEAHDAVWFRSRVGD